MQSGRPAHTYGFVLRGVWENDSNMIYLLTTNGEYMGKVLKRKCLTEEFLIPNKMDMINTD